MHAIFMCTIYCPKTFSSKSILVTKNKENFKKYFSFKFPITQWLARQLATGEALGSNTGKEYNLINF